MVLTKILETGTGRRGTCTGRGRVSAPCDRSGRPDPPARCFRPPARSSRRRCQRWPTGPVARRPDYGRRLTGHAPGDLPQMTGGRGGRRRRALISRLTPGFTPIKYLTTASQSLITGRRGDKHLGREGARDDRLSPAVGN